MADVFPPMNLPGFAIPWGREVQNRLNQLDRGASAVDQTFGNQGLANSGSLAVMAERVNELVAQSTTAFYTDNMYFEGAVAGGGSLKFSTSQTVTVPAPVDRPRGALMTVSVEMETDHTNTSVDGCLEISYQGQVIAAISSAFGAGPSRPTTIGAGAATAPFKTDGSGGSVFTLRFFGQMYNFLAASGTRWAQAENIVFTTSIGA